MVDRGWHIAYRLSQAAIWESLTAIRDKLFAIGDPPSTIGHLPL
jgi:hypothetical protein